MSLTFTPQLNLDGQLDDFEDEYTPGQPIKTEEAGEAGRPPPQEVEMEEEEPSSSGIDPLDCLEFEDEETETSTTTAAQVCDDYL